MNRILGRKKLLIDIILKCVNLYSKLLLGSSQRRQFMSFEKIPAELKISIFSRLFFKNLSNFPEISN